MRPCSFAALRRLWLALWVLCAAAAMPLEASAQATEQVFIDKGCSAGGCHGNPAIVGGLIPFADATLLSSLNAFLTRIRKPASNLTMQNFGNGVGSSAAEQQAVYDYLVNVRDASVTPSVSAFPTTNVNVTSGTTRTVTILNFRGEALNFTPSLSNTADFGMSNNCANSVAAQSSCTITVSFQPNPGAAPTRTGNLTVNFTSGTSIVPPDRTIALSGTVTAPLFAFAPGTTTFQSRIGTPLDVTVGTVSNGVGRASFTLSSIAQLAPLPVPSDATYTLLGGGGNCVPPLVLDSGESCNVRIRYTPAAASLTEPTFRMTHTAAGSPDDVELHGTGTQPLIDPTVASLDFGNVQHSVATPRTVVLTNSGNMALTFTADPKLAGALSGANTGDFAVGTNCASGVGATLGAGGACTITVTFTPPPGAPVGVARTATLTVNTDANNNGGVLSVTLAGTPVVLPEPAVTFPASDFPDTTIGETAAQTRLVTIVNDRTLDIGYSVPNTTDFNVVSESCPTHVVPGGGGSCTVTWRFQPQLAGGETRRTANVTFSFTGSGGNPAPSNVVGGLAGRALLPLGAPAALTPNAGFGLPATTSTLLSNRSATPITLSALSFSGAAAADYALDATNGCALASSIAAGSSCTLVVRFDPSTGGTRNATLTITHDALGSPQAIALNGSATQGAIQLTSFALSFGDTALNANATQTITVENAGTQALNFSALNLTGAAVGDYTRGGSCTAGTPLAVGALCTVAITFQPTALGARSASLTITSDASNGPATVTLSGTGVPIPAPVVTLAPTAIDFGAQTVGNSLYPTRVIRLSNTGNAPLASIAVSLTGAAYSTASVCPATLAPAAGCDIEIRFTPAAANTDYAGTLRVTSNAAGSPHTAALAGRGTAAVLPALVWSPAVTSLDFGIVSSGTVSAPQTATLLNQGPGGVELTVLNAIGPAATSFGIVGGSCAVGMQLFEGQSCTVQFAFAPASAGVRTASVQVASTGSFPPALALAGTGTGGPTPGATLSVAALDLGDTRVGSRSQPAEVTITSSGSGALQLTALAVDGPFVVQGGTCPALPHTLPAGSSCSVALMFLPQSEGAMTGTLRVTTDVPGAALEVALSGEAEAAADVSSGGCSMIDGDGAADPMLWLLVLLAVVALVWRRRTRRA